MRSPDPGSSQGDPAMKIRFSSIVLASEWSTVETINPIARSITSSSRDEGDSRIARA